MRNILLIIKEAYLDKIPNLMTLVRFFDAKGDKVSIVTLVDDTYLVPDFDNASNISLYKVRPKKRKYSLPNSLRLFVAVTGFLFSERLHGRRYKCVVGTGYYGNLIAFMITRFFGGTFVNHCVEYPVLKGFDEEHYSTKDWFYNSLVMKYSDYIITHDDVHVDFITKHLSVGKEKFLKLPNATMGECVRSKSVSIRKTLVIDKEKTIVLHSGGLGVWFSSHELAKSSLHWKAGTVLVFHTSHVASGDEYYEKMCRDDYRNKVFFSVVPLPSDQLDDYVSGADIGLAWYNKSVLGYRCEYMGTAAGKIGNYLKCGLPVIVNNFDSLSSYIHGYGCGICVNCIEEIDRAIESIKLDYEHYRMNAFRCYEELWKPDSYLNTIYERVFS